MFTLIGKCVSYLLYCLEKGSLANHNGAERRQFSEQDELDFNLSSDDNETGATAVLYGHITHLSAVEQYGLVNGDVYFALSSAEAREGDDHLRVGALVELRMSRGGRVAKAVRLIRQAPSENTSPGILIAKVTRLDGRNGRLDGWRSFCFADGYNPEFEPRPGDWVQVHWASKDLQSVVSRMEPLRTREIVGPVSQLRPAGGGVVDHQVSFEASAWQGGRLSIGDAVCARALESDQGPLAWRALSVKPLKDTKESYEAARNGLCEDPERAQAVVLPDVVDLGCMTLGEHRSLDLLLGNRGTEPLHLLGCRAVPDGRVQQMRVEGAAAITLVPGARLVLRVSCDATAIGRSRQRLVFDFEGFQAERDATVEVLHPLGERLAPSRAPPPATTPRRKTFSTASSRDGWVVPGRPPRRVRGRLPVGLPQFPVSGEARQLASCGAGRARRFLQPLGVNNYVELLQLLLHLEEIQRQKDLDQCSLQQVVLEPEGPLLRLHVGSGLTEGCPSLSVGDRVILEHPDSSGPQYEGFIHQVLREDVLLQFEENFHERCLQQESYWDASFRLNRTPLRRCHMAVRLARPLLRTVLFPQEGSPKLRYYSGQTVRWQPVRNSVNERQRVAVEAVLRWDSAPLPHVVFGPPGTGKTVTLVEALLQVVTRMDDSRVLACAPSNSAADLLAVHIWGSGLLEEHEFVRLLSFQRDIEEVPESIRAVCLTPNDLERAARCRVVVSTVATAGSLFALGLSEGHFSHAFVDEAGQLTEPECLIPMVLAASGQVVLCGDPLQLGPVVKSRIAADGGLATSLLERLLATPPYAPKGSECRRDPRLVTKLVESYRCPEPLLRLYSKLFYQAELVSRHRSKGAPVGTGFPVVFHGVRGREQKEAGGGPSWFNAAEALLAVQYVQLAYRQWTLSSKDIGIITPYRKQVEKVRLLLSSFGLEPCKVGSVEEFQGQERRFIIVSTVRTSEEQLQDEAKRGLGFLFSAKRFNVSVSRAVDRLVVLGEPQLLARDPYWKALIDYARENQSCDGCGIPEDDAIR